MKKPKIKKYRGYWLVYQNRKQSFKCFNLETVRFYYNFLLQTS